MVTSSKNGSPPKSANQQIFDAHSDRYSETIDQELSGYGIHHDFFHRHKARLIDRLLIKENRNPAVMNVLDIGCGIGTIHAFIGPKFAQISGVDVSDESIKKARQDFPDNTYMTYAGGRLPLDDESVDMALAICVFHHVPPAEWQHLAAEMLRVLRPNGLALVIEHNPLNPITRRIVNNCPIDRDAVLLPRSQTSKLFKKAQALSVKARSILSVPPSSNFMMSVDDFLGWLPLGAQYYCLARKQEK